MHVAVPADMATVYTDTYYIVATPDAAATLNDSIEALAPAYGRPLQSWLRTAGGPDVPAVYWCHWVMRPADLTLLQSGAFPRVKSQIVPVGGTARTNGGVVCWLFDATQGWTTAQVLAAGGWDYPSPAYPPE